MLTLLGMSPFKAMYGYDNHRLRRTILDTVKVGDAIPIQVAEAAFEDVAEVISFSKTRFEVIGQSVS